MNRRDLIAFFAALWPSAARPALSRNRPLIAWFSGQSQESATPGVAAFREGLRELDYTEGQNIEIIYRFGERARGAIAPSCR